MEPSVRLANPQFGSAEVMCLVDTILSGEVSHRGKYHKLFEAELSKFLGKKAIACSSGTAALHLALLAEGIGLGDEVILPVLTFGTAASVIKAVGATPVFVDVLENGCIDPEKARSRITKKTAAIMPVHLYGETACIDFDTTVIEDSCEAFGLVPPKADYACFSFYANKVITTGEGGALVGRNLKLAEQYRNGGFDENYAFQIPGLNYRMTAMQAALGCAQMGRVGDLIQNRLNRASQYEGGFGKWMYVVQVKDPASAVLRLRELGIESRRVFCPLNLSPAFRDSGSYPMAMKLWNHGLCLPTDITAEQQQEVKKALHELQLLRKLPDRLTHVA